METLNLDSVPLNPDMDFLNRMDEEHKSATSGRWPHCYTTHYPYRLTEFKLNFEPHLSPLSINTLKNQQFNSVLTKIFNLNTIFSFY